MAEDPKAFMKSSYTISVVITVAEPKIEPKVEEAPKENTTAAVKPAEPEPVEPTN